MNKPNLGSGVAFAMALLAGLLVIILSLLLRIHSSRIPIQEALTEKAFCDGYLQAILDADDGALRVINVESATDISNSSISNCTFVLIVKPSIPSAMFLFQISDGATNTRISDCTFYADSEAAVEFPSGRFAAHDRPLRKRHQTSK